MHNPALRALSLLPFLLASCVIAAASLAGNALLLVENNRVTRIALHNLAIANQNADVADYNASAAQALSDELERLTPERTNL